MNFKDKVFYKLRQKYYSKKLVKFIISKPPSVEAFENVIAKHKSKNCFIHGGYSMINSFFKGTGEFDKFVEILDASFENIISPAYTLTFKDHGVFHCKYSKPDVGYFSQHFKEFAKFRTIDPHSSVWIRGKLTKNEIDLSDSFSLNRGIFNFLDNNESSTLCIGTDVVIISFMHYLERILKVNYRKEAVYEGVIYFDDVNFAITKHKTQENQKTRHFEKEKQEYELLKNKVITRYDFGPLSLRIINHAKFHVFFKNSILKDPYFLFYEKG